MIDNEDQKSSTTSDTEETDTSSVDQKTTDDTSDSPSLQGEEGESGQNEVSKQPGPVEDDNKNEGSVHNNEENLGFAGPPDLPQVLEELSIHCENLEDILKWKEELKLLHLDAVLALPYYESWRVEANNWFRRSVILRSRKRRIQKKGA